MINTSGFGQIDLTTDVKHTHTHTHIHTYIYIYIYIGGVRGVRT